MIEWTQSISWIYIGFAAILATAIIRYTQLKFTNKPTSVQITMAGIYLIIFCIVVSVLKIIAYFL